MTTKKLTFKSMDLGRDVNLLLCFTPPTPDLFVKQFPVAWKVTTLASTGRSTFEATYISTLGFNTPQVGSGNIISAGNYTPINAGQETELSLNTRVSPPTRIFSNPVPVPGGADYLKAINKTGSRVDIGLGFVTNLNKPNESMETALFFADVGNGLAVTANFTPILKAYIALDYKENDILRADVQNDKPIWQANLLSLDASSVISISKNDLTGGYEGKLLNARPGMNANAFLAPIIKLDGGKTLYTATLSFAAPNMVMHGIRLIAEELARSRYEIKLTYSEGDADAHLEIVSLIGGSCDEIERDMLGVMDVQFEDGEARIKNHSGALMVRNESDFAYWTPINPASAAWFVTAQAKVLKGRKSNSNLSGYRTPGIGSRSVSRQPSFSNGSESVSVA